MQKLYALYYCRGELGEFRDVAFSNDIQKLRNICPNILSWTVGSYDITNEKNMVSYSSEKTYPRYKIVEVPYVC